MTITITALNNGDTVTPFALDRWAPSIESGNIIHRMLDGSIAVVLVGDLPPTGTLSLWFATDAEAIAARNLLGRATDFTLEHTGRPAVDMTFVRQGTMTPAIHETLKDLWVFQVGYQEIAP